MYKWFVVEWSTAFGYGVFVSLVGLEVEALTETLQGTADTLTTGTVQADTQMIAIARVNAGTWKIT